MPTARTSPDVILAYVRVLRLTDTLLDVAEELRVARDRLQSTVEVAGDNQAEGRNE